MKIYTRRGDDGRTHLCSGPRVSKNDPHIEACGAVDELNAFLGLVRSEPVPADIDSLLHRVQHELFSVGADLAMPGQLAGHSGLLSDEHVAQLEREIDLFDGELPPLTEFILPGGSRASALLHCARTICRRAERRVVSLIGSATSPEASSPVIRYLNRLADLLFVLPRVVNSRAAIGDENWRKDRPADPAHP